jgi:hypothetical protein
VLAIEHGDVAPADAVQIVLAPYVGDEPLPLRHVVREGVRDDTMLRLALRLELLRLVEQRRVVLDQPPREREDLARAAPILS